MILVTDKQNKQLKITKKKEKDAFYTIFIL